MALSRFSWGWLQLFTHLQAQSSAQLAKQLTTHWHRLLWLCIDLQAQSLVQLAKHLEQPAR